MFASLKIFGGGAGLLVSPLGIAWGPLSSLWERQTKGAGVLESACLPLRQCEACCGAVGVLWCGAACLDAVAVYRGGGDVLGRAARLPV